MEKIIKIKKSIDVMNMFIFVTMLLGLILCVIGFICLVLTCRFTLPNVLILLGIPIVIFAGQLILKDKFEEEKMYLIEDYIFKDIIKYVEENKIYVDVSIKDYDENTVSINISCDNQYKEVVKQKFKKYGNNILKEIMDKTGDKYKLAIYFKGY